MLPDALRRARERLGARLPSRNARRGWLVALLVAVLLTGGAGAAALALDAPGTRPVAPGDSVEVTFTAYDPENRVLYTTDPDAAKAALADGNTLIPANLSDALYGPRKAVIPAERTPDRADDPRFLILTYLVGAREGDTIHTPYMIHPFGVPRTYVIPREMGPVDLEFDFDLAQLYDEKHRERSLAVFGPRDVFAPGARVPYQFLEATVLSVDGDNAHLRVDPAEGDVLHSQKLGFDVAIRHAGEGQVTLHPDLRVGQVFQTVGCKLPVEDLPQGRFRVVDVGPENVTIEAAPLYSEHLQNATLRLEVNILKVEPPSRLETVKLWLAGWRPFP